jgi:hypothetical protein
MSPRKSGLLHLSVLSAVFIGVAHAGVDNGVTTKSGEYPQVAALKIGDSIFCSGTVVGRNAILTAAHCVEAAAAQHRDITVAVPGKGQFAVTQTLVNPRRNAGAMAQLESEMNSSNASQLSPSQKDQRMREIFLSWADAVQYDVALLKVPSADLGDPLPIRSDDAAASAGTPIVVVGYGLNDRTPELSDSPTEREGSNTIAASWNGLLLTIGKEGSGMSNSGERAADGRDASVDEGDSGGAMLSDGRIVGVLVAGCDVYGPWVGQLRRLLADGEKLYQESTNGRPAWSFAVPLSSPASKALLDLAASDGFDLAYAGKGPALPTQATAPTPAPRPAPARSQTLEALQNGGVFGQ